MNSDGVLFILVLGLFKKLGTVKGSISVGVFPIRRRKYEQGEMKNEIKIDLPGCLSISTYICSCMYANHIFFYQQRKIKVVTNPIDGSSFILTYFQHQVLLTCVIRSAKRIAMSIMHCTRHQAAILHSHVSQVQSYFLLTV